MTHESNANPDELIFAQDAPLGFRTAAVLRSVGWWCLLVICVAFGCFALWMGGTETLSLAGIVEGAKERALPMVFVVHAVAGGVALIAGALQFNQRLRTRNRPLHRIIGRIYVGAVWTASLGGLWSALFFAVDIPARVMFGVAAIFWFTATTLAFWHIRQGRVALHRNWMTRSFALSLFFVTFQPWVEGLEGAGLTHAVAYPLGVFLSWSINLVIAEVWLRRSRPPHGHRQKVTTGHARPKSRNTSAPA